VGGAALGLAFPFSRPTNKSDQHRLASNSDKQVGRMCIGPHCWIPQTAICSYHLGEIKLADRFESKLSCNNSRFG
jgi:hypothetical protein